MHDHPFTIAEDDIDGHTHPNRVDLTSRFKDQSFALRDRLREKTPQPRPRRSSRTNTFGYLNAVAMKARHLGHLQ